MSVTFVIGRAGAGKTRFCLDAIAAALQEPDDSKLWLLVPEQASFQMEFALVCQAPRGGYVRAEVLSFSRLARRVFDETGSPPVILTPEARRMALHRILAETPGAAKIFGDAAGTPGVLAGVDGIIGEMICESVSAEQLESAGANLGPETAAKIHVIASLCRSYSAWLSRGYVDPDAVLQVLHRRMDHMPFLPSTRIWVDGFAGFTAQELQTLVELARRCRDMWITLLLDPDHWSTEPPIDNDLNLFHRTEVTHRRLRHAMQAAGVAIHAQVLLQPSPLPRFQQSVEMAALEAGLVSSTGDVEVSAGSGELSAVDDLEAAEAASESNRRAIEVLECPSHREELRAAARWVLRKVATGDGKVHFRDFAIIARDLDAFAPLVADVLTEYGVPYFLDQRRPLRTHALARFLQALFDAVQSDLSRPAMVRLIRTGLLPMRMSDAERLEGLVLEHEIHGADLWSRKEWTFADPFASIDRPGARGESAGGANNGDDARRAAAERFHAARFRVIHGLSILLGPATSGKFLTGAAWAGIIFDSLLSLGVPRVLQRWITQARKDGDWEIAEAHRLAWDSACDMLDELHTVLSDAPLRFSEVASLLETSLESRTLGLAPPTIDQVLVSSIERSRHPEIRFAWVFGFNEGVFPATPPDDQILTAADRDALSAAGLAAPASRRAEIFGERLLAYIAFTRPSRELTISYAMTALDGEPRLPSPLLTDVLRSLKGLAVTVLDPFPPPPTLTEAARGFFATSGKPDLAELHARFAELAGALAATPRHAPTWRELMRGLRYKNEAGPVGCYRQPRADDAGVIWEASASEAETFLQCPFQHFSRYGLFLGETRRPSPEEWTLGGLAHEILAALVHAACSQGVALDIGVDGWLNLLDEQITVFQAKSPADLAVRHPRLHFLSQLLPGFLREVVRAHAARWERGDYAPVAAEWRFGRGGKSPAVKIPLGDGRFVALRGSIDRIDVLINGDRKRLLIFDYKTKHASLHAEFLTRHRLQVLLYALAAELGFDRRGRKTSIDGVFLAPLFPDLSVAGTKSFQELCPEAQQMLLYRPRGLFSQEAARRMDRKLGNTVSPVAAMRLTAKGEFDKRGGDALPSDELRRRIELARATLKFAADGIAIGCIEIAPLVEDDALACNWCEYASVCRFDATLNTPRSTKQLPQLDEIPSASGAAANRSTGTRGAAKAKRAPGPRSRRAPPKGDVH